MKVTIDKTENKVARLLIRPDEDFDFHLPVKYLPSKAKEGSILNVNFEIDNKETETARVRIQGLINKLKDKNN